MVKVLSKKVHILAGNHDCFIPVHKCPCSRILHANSSVTPEQRDLEFKHILMLQHKRLHAKESPRWLTTVLPAVSTKTGQGTLRWCLGTRYQGALPADKTIDISNCQDLFIVSFITRTPVPICDSCEVRITLNCRASTQLRRPKCLIQLSTN